MSYQNIAKVGCQTERMTVTASSSTKTLPESSRNILIHNNGSNTVFVQTGAAGLTLVFPTTSTGQDGAIILAGQSQVYEKNNPTDNTLYAICDTALSSDIFISLTNAE